MQPVMSGAGIAEVNDAFLIDASLDPPLIRTLPKATIAREDSSIAILSSGTGVTFLGATYSNLASATAYAYFLSTQAFSTSELTGSVASGAPQWQAEPLFAIFLSNILCSCVLFLPW